MTENMPLHSSCPDLTEYGYQKEYALLFSELFSLTEHLLQETEFLLFSDDEQKIMQAEAKEHTKYAWITDMLRSLAQRWQLFEKQYRDASVWREPTVLWQLDTLSKRIRENLGDSVLRRDARESVCRETDPEPLGVCASVRRYYQALTDGLSENGRYALLTVQDGIDWSARHVLVGSLGSEEQFADNLARRYYYVPEENLATEHFPVSHIALYRSKRFSDPGIRYYGAVTECRRIRREKIRFPQRRNNGKEWYYAFRIREWQVLPKAIEVKEEGVFYPKFTNLFLLTHATQSYELFQIRSPAEYALLYELKNIFSQAAARRNADTEAFFLLRSGCAVRIRNHAWQVLDRQGRYFPQTPVALSDFWESPGECFVRVAHIVREKQQEQQEPKEPMEKNR